jgi:hypothetical protein
MLNPSEKAYCLALTALKQKKYSSAADYFEKAAPYFRDNREFQLLRESTRMLVAVKDQLAVADNENDALVIEEVYSNGQETELPG